MAKSTEAGECNYTKDGFVDLKGQSEEDGRLLFCCWWVDIFLFVENVLDVTSDDVTVHDITATWL